MNIRDIMGLWALLDQKVRELREGQAVPFRWTLRKKGVSYLISGSVVREKTVDPS